MKIEYEASFFDIDKNQIREKLKNIGAELVKEETLMKRVNFEPPYDFSKDNAYVRVRDEGDKITMTFKVSKGGGIEGERESEIEVKNFEDSVKFLNDLGLKEKAYQENLREVWEKDGVEIMIDSWPFLKTYIEIESDGEEKVKNIAEKLGFNWGDAYFGTSVTEAVKREYGLDAEIVNKKTPKIVFDMENPFLNRNDD